MLIAKTTMKTARSERVFSSFDFKPPYSLYWKSSNFTRLDTYRIHSFLLAILTLFQGVRYNIPISVYLWDTHPYYAPICYVSPTPTMVIRESEHVTKQGRVFLPYLSEWRFPGYDLNGLLQVSIFYHFTGLFLM